MTEILRPEQYEEYEQFCKSHPRGGFTQSTRWFQVKNNWQGEVVVVRDDQGKIVAGCAVLVQKLPLLGAALLYAPRGPVCDLEDRTLLKELKAGLDQLAKKHKAYQLKWDPEVLADDQGIADTMKEMGFSLFAGPEGFETIQARFNYHLFLQGRSEEALFQNLTQKTRYNVRVAMKHGVEIRVVGTDYLDEFVRIMQTTGQRDGFQVRPKSYFERMLQALGEHARLYMGFFEGHPVCGAIATNYAGKTCYVYGASDNLYRNVMPNYLMQWEMIRWAAQTGCTLYDFQGVSGNLDENGPMYGLYRFKRGFNGQLDEFAGEWNYTYRPLIGKLVDLGMAIREKRRKH